MVGKDDELKIVGVPLENALAGKTLCPTLGGQLGVGIERKMPVRLKGFGVVGALTTLAVLNLLPKRLVSTGLKVMLCGLTPVKNDVAAEFCARKGAARPRQRMKTATLLRIPRLLF